ncbi:MAG: family N-acetyltransferase [Aeromicrobium sp.]|nr:family N-acetyltransferase [Aeromicrobium sp.]
MTLDVRVADERDAEVLHEFAALTFPLACPPHLPASAVDAFIATHLSTESFLEHCANPAHTVLLAENEGEPVGYALVKLGRPEDPDVLEAVPDGPWCELSKLYVHPDSHGAGVARELLDAVLVIARRESAATVWLGVNQQNHRANAFYAKHGLEPVGSRRFVVGDRVEEDFVRARRA